VNARYVERRAKFRKSSFSKKAFHKFTK